MISRANDFFLGFGTLAKLKIFIVFFIGLLVSFEVKKNPPLSQYVYIRKFFFNHTYIRLLFQVFLCYIIINEGKVKVKFHKLQNLPFPNFNKKRVKKKC